MRRKVAGALAALLLAGCGTGQPSVFGTSSTTAAPGTSASAAPSTSTTAAAASTTAPPADIVVWQVLRRWDGASATGSFEATVCNLGSTPAAGLEVALAANGVEVRAGLPEIPGRGCVDAGDPQAGFAAFGLEAGATAVVRAAVRSGGVEVAAREETITVDLVSGQPDAAALAAYEQCMAQTGVHGNCVALTDRVAFADPHEVMKQAGRYVVVVPAGWEPLAAMTLADLAICVPRIEDYLGLPLPGHATPLVWRFSEAASYVWFGSGAGIQQITLSGQDFYAGVLSGQYAQHSWELVFQGLCAEAHEPTHVVVDALMGLPIWLNEGLATYLSHPDRVGWYLASDRRCTETGYYTHELDGREVFVPYAALGADPSVAPAGDTYYNTGACFWEYLERTFGHEAFQGVMRALGATREGPGDPFQGCPKFLELATPVLGEDISPLTQERFGFGPEYARCTLGG